MTDSDIPLSIDGDMVRSSANGRGAPDARSVVININRPMATEAEVGRSVKEALMAHERAGGML